MGRLGQNPSSRGYATPTYATTRLTARETFGGTSKAGLGRHIGMGPFTYGAIVNGSGGHKAPPLAGNSFSAAYRAGYMTSPKYPINKTNQLSRVGAGTTGGMTQTPADGVNLEQRKMMQTRVDKLNKVYPAMPINLTNKFITWYDENNKLNGLYFAVTKKVFSRAFDPETGEVSGGGNIPDDDRFSGNNYTITDQNSIKFTTSDMTSYTFTLKTNNDNSIISITKLINKMGNITQNIYDVAETYNLPPVYQIESISNLDGANIAFTVKDTYDEAKNTIIENLDTPYSSQITDYQVLLGDVRYICNANLWYYPDPEQQLTTTSLYTIRAYMRLAVFSDQLFGCAILLGGTDENGNIIELSNAPCT